MEADHVHTRFERTIKRQPAMATPWDWQKLIRTTGATVLPINLDDFKNFDSLLRLLIKKVNTEKNSFLIISAI